ncbi:MAG: hypothetical protein CBD18_00730 [Opitutales bacterium TMED158]|nr:MAG: hypothetical protein CBD18_00730 [Opitutales bacterium TMED158]
MGNIKPIDLTSPKYKESSRLPSDPTRIQSWRGSAFKNNSGQLRQKQSGKGPALRIENQSTGAP